MAATIDINEWAKRWGVSKREIEVACIYLVKRGSVTGEFVGGTDVPVLNGITDIGMDDYENQTQLKSIATETRPSVGSKPDQSIVWVVHARNEKLRMDFFAFLRAIGLNPLEFPEAINLTGKGTPYVGEILDAAFQHAQAVIVLLSPDDEARLKDEFHKETDPGYEKQLTGQPRQNVLFEDNGYWPCRVGLSCSSNCVRTQSVCT